MNEVHTLCGVLGVDFGQTISEVHPSLHRTDHEQSTNISDDTLDGLQHMIDKLKTEKRVRFQKVDKHARNAILLFVTDYHFEGLAFSPFGMQLKDVAGSLFELWNLMDTSQEERTKFARVSYVVRSSESDITEPNILSTETIEQVTTNPVSIADFYCQ